MTALTSSLNPSSSGDSVTFTATVSAVIPSSGVATGTVTFKDGSTSLGSGVLNGSGVATYTTTSLSAGMRTITAVYGGDTNYPGSSTSSALWQIVNDGTDAWIVPPSATLPSFSAPSLLSEASAAQGGNPAGLGYSASGSVRFLDGSVHVTATDLSSAGFGIPWGQTRTWDSQPIYASPLGSLPQVGVNGVGWSVAQLPWLLQAGTTGSIVVMSGSGAERYFDFNGSVYKARDFVLDSLTHTSGNFISDGHDWRSTSVPRLQQRSPRATRTVCQLDRCGRQRHHGNNGPDKRRHHRDPAKWRGPERGNRHRVVPLRLPGCGRLQPWAATDRDTPPDEERGHQLDEHSAGGVRLLQWHPILRQSWRLDDSQD